jgi:GDP-L-fucose synthase
MKKDSRILIIGHADAIEHSLTVHFRANGYSNVLSTKVGANGRSPLQVDFLDQRSVQKFFETQKPEYVFLGSIRSGGIVANQKFGAEFMYENLECQTNVIHAAYRSGVKKLLYFTSSCVYPKDAKQPIKEESFLTGPLEETSGPYAVAKIAGAKLCQTYNRQYGFKAIVVVPATVYGPGSDMDLKTAHVIGALIAKFSDAVKSGEKEVTVWGSGKPKREFLFADDLVAGSLFLMDRYAGAEMINLGCGTDVSIRELAGIIKKISGFKGKIAFDRSKPDGAMRKLLDSRRVKALGWKPKVKLEEGVRRTYEWHHR